MNGTVKINGSIRGWQYSIYAALLFNQKYGIPEANDNPIQNYILNLQLLECCILAYDEFLFRSGTLPERNSLTVVELDQWATKNRAEFEGIIKAISDGLKSDESKESDTSKKA